MLNIAVRTDASLHIGSGHVMRCLVLADALRLKGHGVTFLTRPQEGDLIDVIERRGFPVYKLSQPERWLTPETTSDYAAWLQVDEIKDAQECMAQLNNIDLVVVDHYGIGAEWHEQIKSKYQCKIMVIDDLNRIHNANLIVDQNLWPDMINRYSECTGIKLLGPDYALLKDSFHLLKNTKKDTKNQVLAFFGGSDLTGECIKLLNAAISIGYLPFNLKIISGLNNRAYQTLFDLAMGTNIVVEAFVEDFDLELKKSDYVIGASGVSNWERFCLQVPSTIVSVADNQVLLSEYLYSIKAVRYLGAGSSTCVENYLEELLYLISCWPDFEELDLLDVDGLGALRIVKLIEEGLSYE